MQKHKSSFTTKNKLKMNLSNSKDKLDDNSTAGIYEINCENCEA